MMGERRGGRREEPIVVDAQGRSRLVVWASLALAACAAEPPAAADAIPVRRFEAPVPRVAPALATPTPQAIQPLQDPAELEQTRRLLAERLAQGVVAPEVVERLAEGWPTLQRFLADPDPAVRERAVRSLGPWPGAWRTLAALAARGEPAMRRAALEALPVEAVAREALLIGLVLRDPQLGEAAARRLAEAQAWPSLLSALGAADVPASLRAVIVSLLPRELRPGDYPAGSVQP